MSLAFATLGHESSAGAAHSVGGVFALSPLAFPAELVAKHGRLIFAIRLVRAASSGKSVKLRGKTRSPTIKARSLSASTAAAGLTGHSLSLQSPSRTTIAFFEASRAYVDTFERHNNMFSYLTSGTFQMADLAAVLSHATSNASGIIIFDSFGDSLSLLWVTPAMRPPTRSTYPLGCFV